MRKFASISLAVAALTLPLTALAASEDPSQWNEQRPDVDQTWLLSDLLGDDVIAGENTEVGEVRDVILSDNGDVESILIYSNGNNVERGYRKIGWPVKLFEPEDSVLSIADTPEEFSKQPAYDASEGSEAKDQYRASELMGLAVDVDQKSYGEVADLVVNEDNQVKSFVVDPDGVNTTDYWIPTSFGWINAEQVMVVPYSEADIATQDNESGWDLD